MGRPGSRQLTYSELLRRNREFRLLFWARNVSLLGDWFNMLAVLTLLDQIQGERAGAIGWVLILKLLPLLVLGPAAGVVADRLDRKRILVVTDLARAAVVLGFLVLTFWPRVWLLYGLTVLQISLSAFFEPARTAAVAQVCAPEELVPANALGAVTWSIILTLGAAVGGLANHLFGWQVAIAIDAATYAVSALLVLPLRLRRHLPPARPAGLWHALGFGDALDGFRYMWRNPAVATVVWAKGAWGVGGAITLLLTVFGQRIHRVHESAVLGMTVFYAARGLGTALGPIAARRLVRDDVRSMARAMGVSFAVGALFYVVFGSVRSLPLAVLCVVLAHLGGATIWVFSTVLLQRSVPNVLQGRIFAAELALFTLTFSVSTHVYGRLLDGAGLDPFALARWLGWSLLVAGIPWTAASERWPLSDGSIAAPAAAPPPLEEAARAAD
jgi:MFS family permease